MTREELQKNYSKLSTQELLEILDRKFDYTELAVTIAIEEISKRKISEDEIKSYKDEQFSKAEVFIRRNIIDDLTILQKNFFFFIWVPLINFPFKQNFRDDGYILKLKQSNYYSLLGFVFFILTGIITTRYDLSIWLSLAILIISFLPVYAFDEYFNRQQQIEKLRRLFGSRTDEEELTSNQEF